MIIGNGDLAKVLKEGDLDRPDVIYFASGVSNSQETDPAAFQREADLFDTIDKSKHIVYFSSLSIYYGWSPYVKHKGLMEDMVRLTNSYTIVRIGNILWGNNPYTLINFFKHRIINKQPVNINRTYRYLVDKEEFIHWMKMIPIGRQNEMNITGKMIFVPQLVKDIKKGLYD